MTPARRVWTSSPDHEGTSCQALLRLSLQSSECVVFEPEGDPNPTGWVAVLQRQANITEVSTRPFGKMQQHAARQPLSGFDNIVASLSSKKALIRPFSGLPGVSFGVSRADLSPSGDKSHPEYQERSAIPWQARKLKIARYQRSSGGATCPAARSRGKTALVTTLRSIRNRSSTALLSTNSPVAQIAAAMATHGLVIDAMQQS